MSWQEFISTIAQHSSQQFVARACSYISPQILSDEGSLVICNHRTRVDWMFAGWCFAAINGSNSSLRVILKDALRFVPIYGWGLQLMMFIFLQRKKDQDVLHIQKMINYLNHTGDRPIVFIFPEGTDLAQSALKRSNACQYMSNNTVHTTTHLLMTNFRSRR